jgi:hypothetical protein
MGQRGADSCCAPRAHAVAVEPQRLQGGRAHDGHRYAIGALGTYIVVIKAGCRGVGSAEKGGGHGRLAH